MQRGKVPGNFAVTLDRRQIESKLQNKSPADVGRHTPGRSLARIPFLVLVAGFALMLAACIPVSDTAALPSGDVGPDAPPSVQCEATESDQMGPFYEPNAPFRSQVGSGYVLSGRVLAVEGCVPVPDALIEFWLANPQGDYDDDHRASMMSDSQGLYQFESPVPVPYTGRPPHIHVRVSAPGFRPLVTQHYSGQGKDRGEFDLVLTRN